MQGISCVHLVGHRPCCVSLNFVVRCSPSRPWFPDIIRVGLATFIRPPSQHISCLPACLFRQLSNNCNGR